MTKKKSKTALKAAARKKAARKKAQQHKRQKAAQQRQSNPSSTESPKRDIKEKTTRNEDAITTDPVVDYPFPVDVDEIDAETLMHRMLREAEQIEEDDDIVDKEAANTSAKMLTPQQVQEQKAREKAKTMSKAEKRAALRRKIRGLQADRAALTAEQRLTDSRGKKVTSQVRPTQAQMMKAQAGQLGKVDPNNVSEEQIALATQMMETNPHLSLD